MSQEATLHIKVDPAMARGLKELSGKRKQTMGQLVREAIVACYQIELQGLTTMQSEALAAYRGGFISLGKLAEMMGIHSLDLRRWLDEHGITVNTSYGAEDAANA